MNIIFFYNYESIFGANEDTLKGCFNEQKVSLNQVQYHHKVHHINIIIDYSSKLLCQRQFSTEVESKSSQFCPCALENIF